MIFYSRVIIKPQKGFKHTIRRLLRWVDISYYVVYAPPIPINSLEEKWFKLRLKRNCYND